MQTDPTVTPTLEPESDAERDAIVENEEALLARTLNALSLVLKRYSTDYDHELLSLRDQISEARAVDLPPLMQQMERLSQIAARRAEVPELKIDSSSPYFGHLRLEEKGRMRDVLIGNATYVDTERGVRVVDWRDAPISQLYYRYGEGDEYEEEIGGRTLEGVVQVRRSVVIVEGTLRRVMAPQGTFVRQRNKEKDQLFWRRLDVTQSRLTGGQGLAERPPALDEYSLKRGRLGVRIAGRDDRHLPEIPALIDRRQFELISKPGSGLVVIQGGAGSGKTTIGLHRLAYLNFNDPRRFAPEKMLVVVFNEALVTYIGRVLPGLGVEGVHVTTYGTWAEAQRKKHLPRLPSLYTEDTPPTVTRLKKHPAMLTLIDERVAREVAAVGERVEAALAPTADGERACAAWRSFKSVPLAARLTVMGQFLRGERTLEGAPEGGRLAADTRSAGMAVLDRVRARARDVVWDWAELLTDGKGLAEGFARLAPAAFTEQELATVVRYCTERVEQLVLGDGPEGVDDEGEEKERPRRRALHSLAQSDTMDEREQALGGIDAEESPRREGEDAERDDDADRYRAMDGRDERDEAESALDREDDALLLRLYERKRGPLRRDKKMPLLYEHAFIDEAQDLSPVETAVLLGCVTPARSITMAGDTAQRLLLDNGFTDWKGVLRDLGLESIQVEPLRIGYRSTLEVLELARDVLGPLADPEPPVATRSGAPVEMHRFSDLGAAVAYLGESLRALLLEEPRANVAVITRDPERAEIYYRGLERAEVPHVSIVRRQDFAFKPGVEVTDIRQVKGLEFDYVVLVDVTHSAYPPTDESRHLLHIGATRAAHQLWLFAVGEPSRLLPDRLRD